MEVAEAFNLSQPQIGKIMQKFNTKLLHILKIDIEDGKSFEEIANNHNLNQLTPYIKHFEDKSDLEKI